MKFSESIANISSAICQFQSIVENPKKNQHNQAYSGAKYADLDSIIHAIRPALEKSGLSFIQNPVKEEGFIGVYTIILHKSGEFIQFDPVFIPVGKLNPHQVGAALTYARRYSLGAALGIATEEDDDANSLQKEFDDHHKTQTNQTTKQGKEKDNQKKRFFAIAAKRGFSEKAQKAVVYFFTGKTSRKQVTEEEYRDIADFLEKATIDEINEIILTAVKKAKKEEVAS